MVTPKQAKEKSTSKNLEAPEEIHYYNLLVAYTDYYLLNSFDGVELSINLENASFRSSSGSKTYIFDKDGRYNEVITGGGRMPYWRQRIVREVWLKAYKDLGWDVSGDFTKEGIFKFKYDNRNERLNEILNEKD